MVAGEAESPDRKMASTSLRNSAVLAASPSRLSSVVGPSGSISLAFSSANARNRVPLPSGPIAMR